MKRSLFLVVTMTLFTYLHQASAGGLVEDGFSGSAGATPDAAKFEWGGQVGLSGAGQLNLSTDTANTSWIKSKAGAVVSPGQTLVLQMRLSAYAEPAVYGDKQPRGLRVGSDANNVLEFYSIYGTTIGLRARKDGVETLVSYPFPAGVYSMHDYEISVTSTSAVFKVDGVIAGTLTSNLPTNSLNFFISTYDGGFGNVPVTIDSVSLSLTNAQSGTPPAITSQPTNLTVNVSSNAIFSVTATGTAPLFYQWVKNGGNVSEATNASLTLPNVQTNQAGNYTVVITNAWGSVTSSVATLTVLQTFYLDLDGDGYGNWSITTNAVTCPIGYVSISGDCNDSTASIHPGAVEVVNGMDDDCNGLIDEVPHIVAPPTNQVVAAGGSVTFTFTPGGADPCSYQWQFNSTNIAGATGSSLTITNVGAANQGNYRVSVTNIYGSVISPTAALTVIFLPPVISSFTPSRGPVGSSVTINGANFTTAIGVLFNGATAPFSISSSTQIVATVPASALSGMLTVINTGGAGFSSQQFVVQSIVKTNDEASLDAALTNNLSEAAFACDGTINITSTKVIASDMTLDGASHSITISGGNAVRVFTVNPGIRLTLKNLTVANGHAETYGGGIYNNGGIVTLVDCTFTNNAVYGTYGGGNVYGGAVDNENSGTLFVTNCTFAVNKAVGGVGSTGAYGSGSGGWGGFAFGGGIYIGSGSATFVNCTFNGNQAIGGMGGTGGPGTDGYQYWYSTGLFSGYWVTVYGTPGGQGGNGADGFGGSLAYTTSGSLTMVNNTLARGQAAGGNGGAPGNPGAYASGNYGWGYSRFLSMGGNMYLIYGSTIAMKNNIIAYGTGSPGYNYNCLISNGSIVDNGNNLCSDSSAAFTSASSFNSVDPLLAADLAANGGPTLTLALATNSPAINSGDSASAPTTDQRHMARAGVCDMGAYEYQTPASAISYAWLQSHGLPIDGSADLIDSDCDGMNTFQEWITGTDPASAGSCLKLHSPSHSESGLLVSWQSVSGKIYLLQRSTNLGATTPFTTLQSNLVGQPGTTIYYDTNAIGAGPFFYRVGVQP